MPGQLIELDPKDTPQAYYDNHKEQLYVVPDGTGLQILFNIEDDFYVVAGPRRGKIISVVGGKIENNQLSFATQLAEELNEETFGMLQLVVDTDGKSESESYRLLLKDGSTHALSIQNKHTFLKQKNDAYKYAYVTFTAVCNTLTLEELQKIAQTMSPTADFWNIIGNYLFQEIKNAPKDDTFAAYWKSIEETRNTFIAERVNQYNRLINEGKQLLIDPNTVFNKNTIEESLQELHNIADYKALKDMLDHNVGRYSERSGYQVFRASELSRAAQPDCTDKNVQDITGEEVAKGILNDAAVAAVIPAVTINPIRISAAGVLKFGTFAKTTTPTPVSSEKARHIQTTNSSI